MRTITKTNNSSSPTVKSGTSERAVKSLNFSTSKHTIGPRIYPKASSLQLKLRRKGG